MAVTLTQAQTHLDRWVDASEKLSQGLTARVDDKLLTRSDWDQVERAIAFWQRKVNELTRKAAGLQTDGMRVASFSSNKI